MQFLANNYGLIITFLFLLSEALAIIPSVKSNGVFQLVVNILKSLKDKIGGASGPSA